jgi:hypothetical protein
LRKLKTAAESISDFFGYLPHESSITFREGEISPVQQFDDVVAWIDKYKNEDGFLYPPVVRKIKSKINTATSCKEVPNSARPALLHRVPASHELRLFTMGESREVRKGPSSFIIHLLAYLFGVRLQFHDWWFDGRIPVKSTHNIHLTKKAVEDFLSHCYRTWQSWPEKEQRLITNILYMHSRSPSYEWDWERFMIEYTVLDGCWNLSTSLYNLNRCKHEDRIHVLCEKFCIPVNEKLIHDIVSLRNDLFHETLWDKSQPCTATKGPGLAASFNLRRFNQRLIPAILGYDTPYVKTGWWYMGTFSFD